MILSNPRYNQLFLCFSTLLTVISLFLYYSIKDLSSIKQELKNISTKLDKKPSIENVCPCPPKSVQVKDKKVVKENHDETKNIVKEIVDHIDDEDDDIDGSITTEDLEKHLS